MIGEEDTLLSAELGLLKYEHSLNNVQKRHFSNVDIKKQIESWAMEQWNLSHTHTKLSIKDWKDKIDSIFKVKSYKQKHL